MPRSYYIKCKHLAVDHNLNYHTYYNFIKLRYRRCFFMTLYYIFKIFISKIVIFQRRSFLTIRLVLRKRNALLHPTNRIKKKVISGKGEGTGQNWYRQGDS